MVVNVPPSLAMYEDMLHGFFRTMIMKLDKNSHKETPTKESIPSIMDLLRCEITEFEEQMIIDKFDENSLIELADQANFAFLAYAALRMQGVQHEQDKESYVRVR
jgi:hypothetical protein